MKFCLVERQESRIRCAPDLGAAYLLGVCREAGFGTSLVCGSPRTLYDSLVRDAAAFLDTFKEDRLFGRIIKDRGETYFLGLLKEMYGAITSNQITDKTNPEALEDIWRLTTFLRDRTWPAFGREPFSFRTRLYEAITASKPDVVGFSLWNFYDHPQMAKAISDVMSRVRSQLDIPIIIGGPGMATAGSRQDAFRIFKPDYIVHHEGELAIAGLLSMLEAGDVKDIANVSYPGGAGLVEGRTEAVADLDALPPPDFSDYDLDSFFLPVRVLPLMTARGCEWARCAFCNHHATYPGYHEVSPDRVLELLEHYRDRYKTDMIMLHDETLTARRATQLVDTLSRLDGFYYYSYAYPRGYTKGLLGGMYSVGFRTLVWGVESGNQAVLESMRKGTNVTEIESILKASREAGIINVLFLLFGFPGETSEAAMDTVKFLERNKGYVERHSNSVFFLQEGSPVALDPSVWGVEPKGGTGYKVEKGMQNKEAKEFLKRIETSGLRTASGTMYHMPGDTEFRAYLFMQSVYGETSDFCSQDLIPVRNGVLRGDTLSPSFFGSGVCRPVLHLSGKDSAFIGSCGGIRSARDIDDDERIDRFLRYPYIVFYRKPFLKPSH